VKKWISQGMFAEHAVILANLYIPQGGNDRYIIDERWLRFVISRCANLYTYTYT
jgi:hypothetical protein